MMDDYITRKLGCATKGPVKPPLQEEVLNRPHFLQAPAGFLAKTRDLSEPDIIY
jgi:hypothetical protein